MALPAVRQCTRGWSVKRCPCLRLVLNQVLLENAVVSTSADGASVTVSGNDPTGVSMSFTLTASPAVDLVGWKVRLSSVHF